MKKITIDIKNRTICIFYGTYWTASEQVYFKYYPLQDVLKVEVLKLFDCHAEFEIKNGVITDSFLSNYSKIRSILEDIIIDNKDIIILLNAYDSIATTCSGGSLVSAAKTFFEFIKANIDKLDKPIIH